MNVTIEKDLCIGCGLCAANCPDVYEMRDTVAVVTNETPSGELEQCARQAAAECPTDAIRIS